ncbi:hypothetical protein [Aquincola sp. J276]|uniref:hypothetical protein n=1 Tax=Aquincola sp. J276 TaxID=2898432 RepID=UPI0021513AFC|nr:hypothetical protein [Aquincola sp. J276]MCR5867934.1 hypothetical protein [Aquincola sp. J276]
MEVSVVVFQEVCGGLLSGGSVNFMHKSGRRCRFGSLICRNGNFAGGAPLATWQCSAAHPGPPRSQGELP